jgi:hypothetical protein
MTYLSFLELKIHDCPGWIALVFDALKNLSCYLHQAVDVGLCGLGHGLYLHNQGAVGFVLLITIHLEVELLYLV